MRKLGILLVSTVGSKQNELHGLWARYEFEQWRYFGTPQVQPLSYQQCFILYQDHGAASFRIPGDQVQVSKCQVCRGIPTVSLLEMIVLEMIEGISVSPFICGRNPKCLSIPPGDDCELPPHLERRHFARSMRAQEVRLIKRNSF